MFLSNLRYVNRVLLPSNITIPVHGKRLSRYDLGDFVDHDGKLWESQIEANFNRKPGDLGNYWKEIPSNYSVEREDWNLMQLQSKRRIFFMSPDGRLF